jgi:AraC-like DNA-binding protein
MLDDMERRRVETELGRWEAVRRPPMSALTPYVEGAVEGWSQEATIGKRLREVPFPGIPLILNLGEPWEIEEPDADRLDRRDSFVAGLHTAPTLVSGAADYSCIELRLTPLGAHQLLGIPMHELTNRTVNLEDLLPGAVELSDRLRDASSWSERFELTESFLARRLVDSGPPAPGVEWSWHRLLRSGGRESIRALADEAGWSPRRMIHRFREQIGLAPKAAARVIRFDRAASALRTCGADGLVDLALECGYSDQSHLNRDFREFAGTTPTAFAAAREASGAIAA